MNGKGGVGKTSLVANLAGLAAASGWRVLTVDLDPQGNLETRLGYRDRSDQGRGLVAAALDGAPLSLLTDVRPRLDCVAGGAALRNLPNEMVRRLALGRLDEATTATWLAARLGSIAGRYDLVVVDTPPSGSLLHLAAATAARYVLVPTAPDRDSIEGLAEIALLFEEVLHSWNPDIELLGVALTMLVSGGRAIERRARAELRELLAGGSTIFETSIRFAQRAAVDLAAAALLAHEYEERAAVCEPWYTRRGRPAVPNAADVEVYSSAAGGLAADYQRLCDEVLRSMQARRSMERSPLHAWAATSA